MTGTQQAAFQAANGGHSVAEVSTLVGSVFAVLVYIFTAWLVARALSAFYRGNATERDLLWVGLRSSALIAIALWWVHT